MKTFEQIKKEYFQLGYNTAKAIEEHKVVERPEYVPDFAEASFWQGVEAFNASSEIEWEDD